MSPPVHSHPVNKTPTPANEPIHRKRRSGLGASLVLLLLLLVALGTVLEYFGVINLIAGFGRRGRPYIHLGTWQAAELTADVPEDFWASDSIEALAEQGIIRGFPNGEFRPSQPVTRAEFATMLDTAFNSSPTPEFARSVWAFLSPDEEQLTGGFSDVSSDYWAASAIADTTQAGFFSGFPNGEFRPEQPISKAASLVAIANALDLDPATAMRDSLWYYQDAAEIPEYAKEDVAAAIEAGVYLGDFSVGSIQLQPNQPLTRAEAAVLIHRALEQGLGNSF
ncbi:S-layer homology domain-containing protein [Scytonema sp. PRP1]|uniref:S-layer homology domain-containing protein n=1 Tax=Scytonema sp. PRP1 TaxID=3120513 RepID=UPI00300D143E